MLEILQKTPLWVYLLFIVLLIFGIKQTKDRTAPRTALLLLPAGMMAYCLFDMIYTIGFYGHRLTLWSTGTVIAWLFSIAFLAPKGLKYNLTTRKFFVPGSWVPLIIMMGIFSVKYVQGAITALSPEITKTYLFASIFSFLNGVFFGIFAVRIYTYLKIKAANTLNPGNT